MTKFVKYNRNDSVLELVKTFKRAKKDRLKRAYELKFVYGQELLDLYNLIEAKKKKIEHMLFEAEQHRQDDNDVLMNVH